MRTLSLLAVLYFSLVSAAANACSCIAYENIEEHIAANEVIFIGAPIHTRSTLLGFRYGYLERLTQFRVLENMKGVDADTVNVFHGKGYTGSCGLNFEKSESYFIFASTDEAGRLNTSICAATRNMHEYEPDKVDEYREALGKY